MAIIDAQQHTYERNHPGRPWDPSFGHGAGPVMSTALSHAGESTAVPREQLVEAMQAGGIDAAILVTTSHYGWDNSYSLEAAELWPGRFGVVGRIDPSRRDVVEAVQDWQANPAALGLRIAVVSDESRDQIRGGGYSALLGAAERYGAAICLVFGVFPEDYLAIASTLAEIYPSLQIVIDHMGMPAPPVMQPDPDRFGRLPELLALAAYPNVAVKMTAAPSLSQQSFPYRDIWPALRQIVETFGPNRVMWGTDWTRVMGIATLDEGLRYISDNDFLSESEKQLVLGESARQIFHWHE